MPITDSLMLGSQNKTRTYEIGKKQKESESLTKLIDNNGKGSSLSSLEDPAKALKYKKEIKKTECYLEATKNVSDKIFDVTKNVTKTSDLMTDFRKELIAIRSSKDITNTQFSTTLSRILKELEGTLKNPVMGGASELYSSQSVDFSNLTATPSGTTPDYSYCLGCNTGTNIHIDTTSSTCDSSIITASDPMFEEFIRSIRLAQQGNPSDPSDAYFQQAMDLLDSAQIKTTQNIETLTSFQKSLNEKISTMTDSLEKNQELYEEIAIKDMSELVMERAMINNDISALMNNDVVYLQLLQRIMQMSQRLS